MSALSPVSLASIAPSALQGLERANARAAKAASTLSADGAGVAVDAVVDLVVAKADFKANVAVLRTADEMMGALLDIVA